MSMEKTQYDALAHRIAREASISMVEACSRKCYRDRGKVWREIVDESCAEEMKYLEAAEMLERHPDRPQLFIILDTMSS